MLHAVGLAWGVTEVDGIVYAVFDESSVIKTYNADTLSPLGQDIHVEGMKAPRDIVACRDDRQLYIADSSSVWRVAVDGHADQEKWLSMTGDKFNVDTLSVTSQHLLLMSKRDVPRLRQYRLTDGRMVREVSLPAYVKWWYHGVETEHGTIIVGHLGTAETDEGQYAASVPFRLLLILAILFHFLT